MPSQLALTDRQSFLYTAISVCEYWDVGHLHSSEIGEKFNPRQGALTKKV